MLIRRDRLLLCALLITLVALDIEWLGTESQAPLAEFASLLPAQPLPPDPANPSVEPAGSEVDPGAVPDPADAAGLTCTTLSSGAIPRGGSSTLTCPAGSVMTGGGAETLVRHEGARVVVEESYPVANGWRCESRANPTGSFTCYVRCCTVGPTEASR